MSATIEIEGLDQVSAALKKYGKEAEAGIAKDVTGTALEINTAVKKAIQRGTKSGAVYARGGITHQASAPGEAPATDTGALASSVYFQQTSKLTATIGSRLAYAYWLEYGITKIAPRPAWVPATEDGQKKLNERVLKTLERLAK
jgi:hypothetical protein